MPEFRIEQFCAIVLENLNGNFVPQFRLNSVVQCFPEVGSGNEPGIVTRRRGSNVISELKVN